MKICGAIRPLIIVFFGLLSFAHAQDINLTGYTKTFDDEFTSTSWTTNNPKGAYNWSAQAPVSGKIIGYTIHDATVMSATSSGLVNTLTFKSSADTTGSFCAGVVGMKDGSSNSLVTVGTLGSQINSHSGLMWGGTSGFVGMKFTTPAAGLTISPLGRYNVAGSTGTYDIRIFDATTRGDVAKAIVNLSGQPAGWVYSALVNGNVTLQGSHSYYLMTSTVDTLHGVVDYWYSGSTTVTAASGITVNESEWGTWNSGSLFSVDNTFAGFTQRYGYWEARVKMPASGLGSWPSFCLYSTNQSGLNEEVDIFEDYGNNYDSNTDGGALMRNHNWGSGPTEGSANLDPLASKPWLNYHIYGFQADPVHCTFYLDGVQEAQYATPSDYMTSPFYMTLEDNTGGGWAITGLVANSQMDVSWVRVYSLPTFPIISNDSTSGTQGTAFSYQISAQNNPTSYNATGLPSGLTVTTTNGLISGTPTSSGFYNVIMSATNSSGTGSANLLLGISSGRGIGIQFQGSGTALAATDSAGIVATAQTHWNVLTGSSFSNLTLSDYTGTASTAKLNGTAAGTYIGGGSSAPPAANSKLASGEIWDGTTAGINSLTVSSIPYGFYDVYAYADIDASGRNETVSLTPSGGAAQYSSFLTQSGGSTWTQATSTWNGTGTAPTLTGANYVHFAGLTASSFSATFWAPGNGGLNAIQIVPTPPTITSSTTATDTAGTAFNYTITGTTNPTSFNATPLPTGLMFNSSNGSFSGAPANPGTYSIMITANSAPP
jgi:hypothetical protein